MKTNTLPAVVILFFLTAGFMWSEGQNETNSPGSVKTGESSGIRIVPESYLRGWDPVTVFFPNDKGPKSGGPLDNPAGILTLEPAHPGEYKWLDSRTVQFLPSTAWPPLERFTIRAGTAAKDLVTLLVPPVSVSPAPGSDLEPLEKLTFTFPRPLAIELLSQMISIEVKPLPGVGQGDSLMLTGNDFTLKAMERTSGDGNSVYVLTLLQPIGYGKQAVLRLSLSLDRTIPGSVAAYTYMTRKAFAVQGLGSNYNVYPVTSNGSIYTRDQAMNCGSGNSPVFIEFSEEIIQPSIETVKRFVRFEPAVKNLKHRVSGNRLYLEFSSDRDVPYRLTIRPTEIQSASGRVLSMKNESSFYFYYTQLNPYLQWNQSKGIVERYGPQFFPMEGRAVENVDLRIYRIDPLSRNFWPFPSRTVTVNESERPPMPGEEPDYGTQLAKQIRLLGSPPVSRVVKLPITAGASGSRFGLDLKPYLERISGKEKPGTYLVGYRLLDQSSDRKYIRISVTDLSLSTIEEEHAVQFVVTSLATGAPVAGAAVRVEADFNGTWQTVISGSTDKTGQFRYEHTAAIRNELRRIVVTNGDDILVLDPAEPPPHFQNNHWFSSSSRWLSWLTGTPQKEQEKPKIRGFILTERPIYRPEEEVHILGYIRERQLGKIGAVSSTHEYFALVEGPGGKSWTFPVDMKNKSHFYIRFSAPDVPTGGYSVRLMDVTANVQLAVTEFKKEAYRVPRFEIQVSGPDKVPLDREFDLVLTADYYAGGRVVGQEVSWEISQYLYSVRPPSFPGFIFSTDEQFLSGRRFNARGMSFRKDITDDNGSSTLTLNPAIEEDGLPRRYMVEATVRGADTMTVTTTKEVVALPAFMIGLKLPGFIKEGNVIKPEIIVIGHDEKPLAGKELTVRLYQRQWHSYLTESDFTTGTAKYVSDVVDQPLSTKTVQSAPSVLSLDFPVKEAGVYVVEVLGRDNLGRLQKVMKDVYIAGEGEVAWKKTEGNVFETTMDKKSYVHGDEAVMLLKSPYQEAKALVIVESPEKNTYRWVDVKGGQGLFTFQVTNTMHPGITVHTLLMRGRVDGTGTQFRAAEDRGKPVAVANTTYVAVEPAENRAIVELSHPGQVLPGSKLPVTITLKDIHGKPLSGEVALWLVDRAVLSLARELFRDPLSSFIDPNRTSIRIRETRNSVIGDLPVMELPGGDGELEEAMASLMQRVTVRKNFKTVPYFNDTINVVNGKATVTVSMPDNLTEFAVRAIALSGFDKFGTAKSVVSVKLPVIVQSALPRFVRPGDRFTAGGIGRIVEGAGGPGTASITTQGLFVEKEGSSSRTERITWDPKLPQTLFFPLIAPGSLDRSEVSITMAVERLADKVNDAFEARLPVRQDVETRTIQRFVELKRGESIPFPGPDEAARPGSVKQKLIITDEPAILKILSALRFNAVYEYDCTEQQVSRFYPTVLLESLFKSEGLPEWYRQNTDGFNLLFQYLKSAMTSDGLYAYWPGSKGYVSLTAYVVEFLTVAKAAGYTFDNDLIEKPKRALTAAIRSDYNNFIRDSALLERVDAMIALNGLGYFDQGYTQELLASAEQSDLYTKSRILRLLVDTKTNNKAAIKRLSDSVWKSLTFKLQNGKETFVGFGTAVSPWSSLALVSDTKTLSAVIRALFSSDPGNKKIQILIDELVNRGDGTGWGSTQDNIQAMLALQEILGFKGRKQGNNVFELSSGGQTVKLSFKNGFILSHEFQSTASSSLIWKTGDGNKKYSAWLLTEYTPATVASEIRSRNEGFITTREHFRYEAGSKTLSSRIPVESRTPIEYMVDDIVEEHVSIIVPEQRFFVAVRIPLASGFEPLNPNLATSPEEAVPAGRLTLQPSYSQYLDDAVIFFYDVLPSGTYHFYFRVRASFEGTFIQPPARSGLMYNTFVKGRSDGCPIVIRKRP